MRVREKGEEKGREGRGREGVMVRVREREEWWGREGEKESERERVKVLREWREEGVSEREREG